MLAARCVRPARRAQLYTIRAREARCYARSSSVDEELWRRPTPLSTLAIETSCDDTAVAVLEARARPSTAWFRRKMLETRFNQRITAKTDAYNGIHPIVALQSHQTQLADLVGEAITQISYAKAVTYAKGLWGRLIRPDVQRPDFISVTRGPGMRSNLSVGLELAKGLSLAWNIPLIGVHHMQAHALTPRLCSALKMTNVADGPVRVTPTFPFLSVLASGGHTMLIRSTALCEHSILAATQDIALGDCLDKAARVILPAELCEAPYGKALEDFAFPEGELDYNYQPPKSRREELQRWETAWGWSLGPPLAESKGGGKPSKRMAYSFSGLLSSVERCMKRDTLELEERRDMAREVLRVSFEHLASRVLLYLAEQQNADEDERIDTVVVSGGVASNAFLRHLLRRVLDVRGYENISLHFPPVELCTDNALMIAWAGMEMYTAGYRSTYDIGPLRKWSMDSKAEDGGILGVGGWLKVSDYNFRGEPTQLEHVMR